MNITDALTVFLGGAVLVVSYAQWRTANQRVVLDLFERRLKAYDRIEDAVTRTLREGDADEEAFRGYLAGKFEARFLFGADVLTYLDDVYQDIVALNTVYRTDAIEGRPDREQRIDKKFETFARLSKFTERAPTVFGPYMRMTQKNTPFWRPW